MSRIAYVMRAPVSAIKLRFDNWASAQDTEAVGTSPVTYYASLEYPIGTIAGLFTFGGANNVAVEPGSHVFTDALNVAIPRGARFALRTFADGPSGICNDSYAPGDLAGATIDVCNYGATVANVYDSTAAITVTSRTAACRPTAVLGQTSAICIGVIGDSRAKGTLDSASDFFGGIGEINKRLSRKYLTLTVAEGGTRMTNAATSSGWDKRISLLNTYCDLIVTNHGINDLNNGVTAASLITALATLRARLGNKPLYACTVAPYTTSTDGWTTLGNQTVKSWEAQRVSFNDKLRAGETAASGVIELADVVESARNDGKWKADGVTAGLYTSDGLHESKFAYDAISNSGIFDQVL